MAANGPGTLRENWPKGPTPSGTTSGSLNHIMMGGGVGVWMYTHVGGLRVAPLAGFPTTSFGVTGSSEPETAAASAAAAGVGARAGVGGFGFEFGVGAAVLRRVGAAAAHTKVDGARVASSWRYDRAQRAVRYNCTLPAGARAALVLPWREGAEVVLLGADGAKMLALPFVLASSSAAAAAADLATLNAVGVGAVSVDRQGRTLTLPLLAGGNYAVHVSYVAEL